jgi:riboflavin kinase/FMN adenylyltransferase
METIELHYPLTQFNRAPGAIVMAIGDFDGVHLGHQEVIRTAKRLALQHDCFSAIMTFHPHPREVLGHTKYAKYIAPYADKMARFAALDIDYSYSVHFDKTFARVTASEFVEEMLMKLNINTVVVGFDFTFGYLGAGTVETLKELADGRFKVEVVRPYHLDGEKVSSTVIREHLHFGDVFTASEFLGRPYQVSGRVVKGEQRGRTIGFPTANIEVEQPYVIPCNGVYIVECFVHGQAHYGVMNIGKKPTFHDQFETTLEAHLFDFDLDIYGAEIQVHFLMFIRSEKRFNGIQELIAQIQADVELAKEKIATGLFT